MAFKTDWRGESDSGSTWAMLGAMFGALRRWVLNLLLVLIGLALVAAWWVTRPASLKDSTVLVLSLDGPLVEQALSQTDGAASLLLQDGTQAVVLRDLLRVLDHAARDPKISSVLLSLDGLSGGGLPQQREVAEALLRFRAGGKKVLAWGMNYDQRAYYIAAHADEVYLHPMGAVLIEGYGRQRNYYRDALDRLGVSANLVRAGAYKNAAEPFVSNAPSAQTLEADGQLYQGLWSVYTQGVERARRLRPGHLQDMIDNLPQSMAAAQGDLARLALDNKLVDGLLTPDALRSLLIDRGARDNQSRTFRQISLSAYKTRLPAPPKRQAVAVVVAEGEIVDGDAPPGRVGGRSTAELLRQAREDEDVRAVVLRVNSPGGSAAGSELIRRELQLTRGAGKPVVASMGDLAASGGYWISMSSDEVIADPATITGSIGVFGLLPTASGLMDKLSIRTGGTGTTWLVGAYDPRRALDPRFAQLVQSAINQIYSDFTTKVAAARKTSKEHVESVAQGRVWSGAQAKTHGLVDRLGGLEDALAAARTRAKLPADAAVRWMEPPVSPLQQAMQWLAAQAWAQGVLTHSPRTGWSAWVAWPGPTAAGGIPTELAWVQTWTQRPVHTAGLVHCLCRAED